jgi:hypothetical protein
MDLQDDVPIIPKPDYFTDNDNVALDAEIVSSDAAVRHHDTIKDYLVHK